MITQIEIEQKIIKITALIQKEYPELAKYVNEMPDNNSENADVTVKTLQEYYHSLEEILKKKVSQKQEKGRNEKGFEDDMSGDDLDVPGAELDNQQESIGSEDDENNYYSLVVMAIKKGKMTLYAQ